MDATPDTDLDRYCRVRDLLAFERRRRERTDRLLADADKRFEVEPRSCEQSLADYAERLRNAVIERYLFLGRRAFERLRQLYPEATQDIEPEDTESAAVFGLVDALDAYQPGQHQDVEGFEAFAAAYVWASIIGELTADDWKVGRVIRVDQPEDRG